MKQQPKLLIGPLSPSGKGQHAPVPQYGFAPSDYVCNASVKKPLEMDSVWKTPARPGSQDFLKFRSRGTGC